MKEQEPKKPEQTFINRFLPFLFLIAGVGLVLLGAYIGQHVQLKEKIWLDIRGVRAAGEAFLQENGQYRIRYQEPGTGAIYARSNQKGLGPQRINGQSGDITVRFDPAHPQIFQPFGISLLPGVSSLVLFITGMALVLRGRRLLIRQAKMLK